MCWEMIDTDLISSLLKWIQPNNYQLISADCHIYASVNLVSIGSDNGLSPMRRQAITWTNACLLSIEPLGTNFSEVLIKIPNFSSMKMHLNISSAKWRPFCSGEMSWYGYNIGPSWTDSALYVSCFVQAFMCLLMPCSPYQSPEADIKPQIAACCWGNRI